MIELSPKGSDLREQRLCTITNTYGFPVQNARRLSVSFITCQPGVEVCEEFAKIVEASNHTIRFLTPNMWRPSFSSVASVQTKIYLILDDRRVFIDFFTFHNGQFFTPKPLLQAPVPSSNMDALNFLFPSSSPVVTYQRSTYIEQPLYSNYHQQVPPNRLYY